VSGIRARAPNREEATGSQALFDREKRRCRPREKLEGTKGQIRDGRDQSRARSQADLGGGGGGGLGWLRDREREREREGEREIERDRDLEWSDRGVGGDAKAK